MMRLAQEDRIMIKEKVNMAQDRALQQTPVPEYHLRRWGTIRKIISQGLCSTIEEAKEWERVLTKFQHPEKKT